MTTTNHAPSGSLRGQAAEWLVRLRSEACTAQDREDFEHWLAKDPAHPRAYAEVLARWEAMETFKTLDFPERKEALEYRPTKKARPARWLGWGLAASVLFILGVTAPTSDGWLGAWYTYTTPKGARETVTPAEGSRVELNTDTKVRVHLNRWWRKVELMRGEAFFTVSHDADRPFEVDAGDSRIRDLGTAFVVHRESKRVMVALLEGRVRVHAQETRELSAGQRLAYPPSGPLASVEQADIAQLTAWRKGQLLFRGHRLADVLTELGRYHDTTLLIRDPALRDLRVSGVFRTHDLESVLNAIKLTLPVRTRHLGARKILLEPAE